MAYLTATKRKSYPYTKRGMTKARREAQMYRRQGFKVKLDNRNKNKTKSFFG